MRRRFLVCAGFVVLASAQIAAARAISPDRPIDRAMTLTFRMKATGSYFNDVNPSGPSLGDTLASQNEILKNGTQVGHVGSTCAVTGKQAVCTAVAWLPQGQLALVGQLPLRVFSGSAATIHLAVTGGTRAFRRVRGDATIVIQGGSKPTTLTLRLSP